MMQPDFHTGILLCGTCTAQNFRHQEEADGRRAGNEALLKLQLPPFSVWLSHLPVSLYGANQEGQLAEYFPQNLCLWLAVQ